MKMILSVVMSTLLVTGWAASSPEGGSDWQKSGDHYSKDCGDFTTFQFDSTEGVLAGYILSVTPPTSWLFIPAETKASAGTLTVSTQNRDQTATSGVRRLTLESPGKSSASATAFISANISPVSFTLTLSGKLTRSGDVAGTAPTWSAQAGTDFFYITPRMAVIPPTGNVTFSAYRNGTPAWAFWRYKALSDSQWNYLIFDGMLDDTFKSIQVKHTGDFEVNGYIDSNALPGRYEIQAIKFEDVLGKRNTSAIWPQSSLQTAFFNIVDAFFTKKNTSGYDDFTDWQDTGTISSSDQKSEDYYDPDGRKGKSGIVYMSVAAPNFSISNSGSAMLNIEPGIPGETFTVNKSGNSFTVTPGSVAQSNEINFVATGAGETSLKVKYGDYTFPRHAVVTAYPEKNIKLFTVKVGTAYGQSAQLTPPDIDSMEFINEIFSQTIIKVDTTKKEFLMNFTYHPKLTSQVPIEGRIYPSFVCLTQWSNDALTSLFTDVVNRFSVEFERDHYNSFLLILHGAEPHNYPAFTAILTNPINYKKYNAIVVMTGENQSGTFPAVTFKSIVAHELGHFLLGDSHVLFDRDNVMSVESVSPSYTSDLDHAGNNFFFRKQQWDTMQSELQTR